MKRKVPTIVCRFPRLRKTIVEALSHDAVLKEMCTDYDAIAERLEECKASADDRLRDEPRYQDLVRLGRQLERDILEHLAALPDDPWGRG